MEKIKYTSKWDKIENELYEITIELTTLGDMIPGLFLNIEEMGSETPNGIKLLLVDIRKCIDDLRK